VREKKLSRTVPRNSKNSLTAAETTKRPSASVVRSSTCVNGVLTGGNG